MSEPLDPDTALDVRLSATITRRRADLPQA